MTKYPCELGNPSISKYPPEYNLELIVVVTTPQVIVPCTCFFGKYHRLRHTDEHLLTSLAKKLIPLAAYMSIVLLNVPLWLYHGIHVTNSAFDPPQLK
jgi:hypothetical protein